MPKIAVPGASSESHGRAPTTKTHARCVQSDGILEVLDCRTIAPHLILIRGGVTYGHHVHNNQHTTSDVISGEAIVRTPLHPTPLWRGEL